ncbi:MAG: hypothetical protein IJK73_01580 [Bacteroidales bacterium]|nr:hypothetical protein [Bacteroidales bacterium]
MNKISRLIFPAFSCIFSLIFFSIPSFAQMNDVLEQVAASRDKAAGVEGPYRFDAAPLTAAPKGYVPFYISHYGRHGSRFAWNANTYNKIRDVLEAAKETNSLTPRGEKLYDDFMGFYKDPLVNTGDLSRLGEEQHSEIARIMCEEFPEVFKDGGLVLARASTSQRAIVSMNAFTVSLQKHAPKVVIEANSLHTNLPIVNNNGAPQDVRRNFQGDFILPESYNSFRERMTDYDGIFSKIFSDRGFLEEIGGRRSFVYELFNLWAGYHNYSDGDWLEDIFTKEQILAQWEIENYTHYAGHTRRRYNMIPLLQDIIGYADEAIDGSGYKAHLRFGHDTVVNAFITLINLDGSGFQPTNAEDVKYWFQNFLTPMASNIQFVLYRSKKNPEVLFKVLRNGQEATLPQLQAVDGPYYKWSDFKSWADGVAAAHPEILP